MSNRLTVLCDNTVDSARFFKMDEWLGYPPYEDYYALNIHTELPLNSAFLMVNTTINPAGLYGRKHGCSDCPLELLYPLEEQGAEKTFIVDTSIKALRVIRNHTKRYIDKDSTVNLFCDVIPSFREFGVYRLDVGQCDVKTVVPPVNTYLPLLFVTLLLLTAFIFYSFVKCMLKNCKCFPTDKFYLKILGEGIQSLHFFKGLLLLLIIFITTGAGGYPVFKRLGLTFTDFLYFAYTWSIGVSIPSNVDDALLKYSKSTIICDACKRAIYLILLGIVTDSTISKLSIDYVVWCPLQKLGVAYFIVVMAYTLTVRKNEIKSTNILHKAAGDFMSLIWCWIISGLLISTMIALVYVLNSNNCQIDLKDTYRMTYISKICNNYQVNTTNLILMGESRSMAPTNDYYAFTAGMMGILSTILSTMMGLKAGTVYLRHLSQQDRLKLWIIWATFFEIGAIILFGATRILDFNLWPISWIIMISALAMYWHSFVYVVTDIWKFKNRTITSTGIASLVIYCGHLLFSHSWPLGVNTHINNHFLYLLQNIATVYCWSCVAVIFVKNDLRFAI